MSAGGPYGTGRSGPAASTTRPPCRPTASMTCSISSPQSNARWTPATGACTATTPARSASRRRSPPRTRPRRCSKRGSRPVTPSHRPGSAWSTPSPTASTGGPCNAGPAGASTCPRPSRQSDHWYPTAPQPGNPSTHHGEPRDPCQDVPNLTAHHVVSPGLVLRWTGRHPGGASGPLSALALVLNSAACSSLCWSLSTKDVRVPAAGEQIELGRLAVKPATSADCTGLQAQLVDLLTEHAPQLGFTASIRFAGIGADTTWPATSSPSPVRHCRTAPGTPRPRSPTSPSP